MSEEEAEFAVGFKAGALLIIGFDLAKLAAELAAQGQIGMALLAGLAGGGCMWKSLSEWHSANDDDDDDDDDDGEPIRPRQPSPEEAQAHAASRTAQAAP